MYAVRHPARSTRARVVHFERPEHLDVWCVANGVGEAIVGGFFLRDPYRPLGELWIDGRPRAHEPVAPPHGPRRGSVVADPDGTVRLLERGAAPETPPGRPAAGGAAARRGRGGRLRRGRPRGILRRRGAVRLGHHRRPASAGGARGLGRVADRGRLRRPALERRRRALDAGACRGDGRARRERVRSTSTAAARPRSSTAATSSTGPTRARTSRRPRRGGVVSALAFEPRR